jgi:transcriptional regulator with XRE-family HTH domain
MRGGAVDKEPITPEQAFGKAVAALRHERGYSQESLAFASGLHRTYISMLERGLRSPKLSTVFRLAAVFTIAPAELVARAEAEMHPARTADKR